MSYPTKLQPFLFASFVAPCGGVVGCCCCCRRRRRRRRRHQRGIVVGSIVVHGICGSIRISMLDFGFWIFGFWIFRPGETK